MGFGDVGGVDEGLVADALTTNVVANLWKSGGDIQQTRTKSIQKRAHHVEVRSHERIRPLFGESKRTAGEAGDEDDGGLFGVTGSLGPDLGTIRGGHVDSEGGCGERKSGEKRSKLHDDAGAVTPWKRLNVWRKGKTGID